MWIIFFSLGQHFLFFFCSSSPSKILSQVIDQVFQTHADVVAKVHAGNAKSAGYLVGEAMRLASAAPGLKNHKPNPKTVKALVDARLAAQK